MKIRKFTYGVFRDAKKGVLKKYNVYFNVIYKTVMYLVRRGSMVNFRIGVVSPMAIMGEILTNIIV